MFYLRCFPPVLLLSLFITGCGTAKTQELSDRVAKLEAENKQLADENARLKLDLDTARKEAEQIKGQQEQLQAAAMEKVQALVKQYGALLGTAGEDLPELQNLNFGDLLKELTSDSATDEGGGSPSKKGEDN